MFRKSEHAFNLDAYNIVVSIKYLEHTERPALGDPEAARLRDKVGSNSPARARARSRAQGRPPPPAATYVTLPYCALITPIIHIFYKLPHDQSSTLSGHVH